MLPLLPALAASSPLVDGRVTGLLDNRLEVYRLNQRLIPSVTGRVIPEPVFTPQAYREEILATMYRDIAAHDPEAILQHEWLNSRGAIARFERNTIEIRLLDVQECPAADLAIVSLLVALLQALVAEEWLSYAEQKLWPVAELEAVLLATIREGEAARLMTGATWRPSARHRNPAAPASSGASLPGAWICNCPRRRGPPWS